MPINLPPVTPQLLKGLEQGRSEQLAALSKVLNIAIGNQVNASVEKIEAITPQQREVLLKLTQEALQQLSRNPVTPAAQAQIARLLEQQQLLGSAQLKWVHLQVNSRPLLTYTDKPLLAGQILTIQLTDAQRLALVELPQLPAAAPATSAGVSSGNTSVTPNSAALANALAQVLIPGARTTTDNLLSSTQSLTQTSNPNSAVPTSAPVKEQATVGPGLARNNAEILNILASALRNLLPQKDQPQQLYPALSVIQHLPVERRQALLSSGVQQALKTLADQLRSPQHLSNPKLLPMIVKNSGVFFEHKLATQLPTYTNAIKDGGLPPIDKTLTNRLTGQDLKGALLQLLQRINQELPAGSTVQPAQSAPVHTGAPQSTVERPQPLLNTLPTSLPGLLQLLQLPQRPERELGDKALRTQLLMLLHQHTLGSLAKIQLQQVQALNHQQNQADPGQPTQSWVFDIPVRHGQDIHHLELKLQQDWVDEDGGENDGSEKKIRQWSVTLSFNLPDAGGFYAQLVVINETVSVKLWAEQQNTLGEARLKLDNLREQLSAQGIVVKQLQCVQGKPPSTNISLHYSLVDITT